MLINPDHFKEPEKAYRYWYWEPYGPIVWLAEITYILVILASYSFVGLLIYLAVR